MQRLGMLYCESRKAKVFNKEVFYFSAMLKCDTKKTDRIDSCIVSLFRELVAVCEIK